MRGGVVLAVLLAGVLITNLASIALLSQPALAEGCPDPPAPCTYCGDGIVSTPNGWGVDEVCDILGDVGCGDGEECNAQCTDCTQTGCNNDGDCDTPVENWVNCPNDCDPPCTPDCAGKECGPDGCDGSCGSCSWPETCNMDTGQCCDNTCHQASDYDCDHWAPGYTNACGTWCSGTWGTDCPWGQACDSQAHTCEEHCTAHSQCPDDEQCKNWYCQFSTGDCLWSANTGDTCTPSGKPLNSGTCDSSGDCVWDGCDAGWDDCDNDGVCDSLNSDQYCGSCDNSCDANESCTNGYCGCVDGTTDPCWPFGGDDRSGIGQCEAGSRTCTNGAYGTCTGGVGPEPEVCGNQVDEDCDGSLDNGCDCTPGETQSCYSGPRGTQDHPPCQEGVQTCDASGQWGECEGEVTPISESCNGIDDNCDGTVDNQALCPGSEVCCGGSCCDGKCIGDECQSGDCGGQSCDNTCCNEVCCAQGQVCHATTGDCCTRNANECGSDGCGGQHPACSGTTPSCVGGSCECTTASCDPGDTCSNGVCVPQGCADTCASLGFECGLQSVCGEQVDCGGCDDGDACTVDSCSALGAGSACAYLLVDPVCPSAGDA